MHNSFEIFKVKFKRLSYKGKALIGGNSEKCYFLKCRFQVERKHLFKEHLKIVNQIVACLKH